MPLDKINVFNRINIHLSELLLKYFSEQFCLQWKKQKQKNTFFSTDLNFLPFTNNVIFI